MKTVVGFPSDVFNDSLTIVGTPCSDERQKFERKQFGNIPILEYQGICNKFSVYQMRGWCDENCAYEFNLKIPETNLNWKIAKNLKI